MIHRPRQTAIRTLLILATALASLVAAPAALAGGSGACKAPYSVSIDPANFVDLQGRPNRIDNALFPLSPGTTFTYEGTKEGQVQRVVFEVTRDTKVIMGVTTTVIHDVSTLDGIVAEGTFDWFAQDDAGNVWYFGEDTKEFDAAGNVISTHGSWEGGVSGALPGIVMQAQPKGANTYRQEFATDAQDMATVLSLSKHVDVPYGSFDRVLLTKEFSCLESGGDHKYYARGVGMVLAVAIRGGAERIELVSVTTN